MSKDFKDIEEVLDILPEESEIKDLTEVEENSIIEVQDEKDEFSEEMQESRRKDYKFARKNLKNAMDIGNEALEDLIEIAKSSQQPRAYEVIATLVKNVSDASDKLMDVNKKLHEIEIIAEPEKNLKNMDKLELNQQNNTYYVGSTADLQELINNTMSDKELIEIDKDDEDE
ncbi:MAG: hypothetical protein CMP21_03780 [Rickettsiales bacterium]|nr:hypothetical protein [Rickettsiales bacterium]|tara:strand:+ start:10168 stop:10683 length:516 start_codon:yes stop_codon:yes gene_type:complete